MKVLELHNGDKYIMYNDEDDRYLYVNTTSKDTGFSSVLYISKRTTEDEMSAELLYQLNGSRLTVKEGNFFVKEIVVPNWGSNEELYIWLNMRGLS